MKHVPFLAQLAAVALAALAAGPIPAHAAVSVTLECTTDAMRDDNPGVHRLYDIDYDASTVREYFADDHGAAVSGSDFTDITSSAQVTDQTIKWTETLQDEPSNYMLDRYTGALTADAPERTTQGWRSNVTHTQCHSWKPEVRQKLF